MTENVSATILAVFALLPDRKVMIAPARGSTSNRVRMCMSDSRLKSSLMISQSSEQVHQEQDHGQGGDHHSGVGLHQSRLSAPQVLPAAHGHKGYAIYRAVDYL